jgi:CRP/FNR family cyclic AMP-dependent transcriptional regulator
MDVPAIDAVGYLGAALVLVSFCMRSIGALRVVAICSNVAFIAYGYFEHVAPVLLLHSLLLPVNIYRLLEPTSRRG